VMTEEVERVWGDAKPAMTLIPVPALALEGMQVEIDVIAVVPD
jgi:enamine deaminase RidA (YjgF/YER057c/UK114 family)